MAEDEDKEKDDDEEEEEDDLTVRSMHADSVGHVGNVYVCKRSGI